VLVLDRDDGVAEDARRRRALVDAVMKREDLLDPRQRVTDTRKADDAAVEPTTAIATTATSAQTPLMIRRWARERGGTTTLAATGTAVRMRSVCEANVRSS
jgi:hypothetical protein